MAALLALAVFRQWFGRLAERETWAPLIRVAVASVPMGIVVLVVSNLSGSTTIPALLVRVIGAMLAGGLTFAAVVIWLGRRHDTHRRPRAAARRAHAARRNRPPAGRRPSDLRTPVGDPACEAGTTRLAPSPWQQLAACPASTSSPTVPAT